MADNFFVSTLKFSLTDDISVHLGKISYNFNSFFDKLSKSEKSLATLGLIAGKKLAEQIKASIGDYSELEQQIVSLGIALDASNQDAAGILSSFSMLKNAIPLDEIRKFVIELANASKKGQELSQNNAFVESVLKVSQAKNIGLDKLLNFTVALTKAYSDLSEEDLTKIVTDLATLSVKAVEGISSVTTKSLQDLSYYKADISKLIPLLATLQEFTGSSSEGIGRLMSLIGNLEGEKGALLYASLGVKGDENFTESYLEFISKLPQGFTKEEIANALSQNWKRGFEKLVVKEGGDIYKALDVLVKNIDKLAKEQSTTYKYDMLGVEFTSFTDKLFSPEARRFYQESIENRKDSERILEEQFNRRQDTLKATFADTGKLVLQLSEQFGELTSNLLNVKNIVSGLNDFLRNLVGEKDKELRYVPAAALAFANPFLGAGVLAGQYVEENWGKQFEEIQERIRKLLKIENVFDLKTLSFVPAYSKVENAEKTSISNVNYNNTTNYNTTKKEEENAAKKSDTFYYSPVFNIKTENPNMKSEISDLLEKNNLDFFKQSKRLNWNR